MPIARKDEAAWMWKASLAAAEQQRRKCLFELRSWFDSLAESQKNQLAMLIVSPDACNALASLAEEWRSLKND